MKILFVIDILTYGGAPKMIVSVATAMAHAGHKVIIHSYASENTEIEIPDNVSFIPGTPFIKNRVLRHFKKIFELRKTICSIKPEVIVAFMPYPSIISMVASMGTKTKTIVCERGDPATYGGFISIVGHKILKKSKGAIFQTEGARAFYKGSNLYNNSVVIPNAITLKKEVRIPENERINDISFVGRFQLIQKRQDVMINAFKLIHQRIPEMTLSFYGDGEDIDIVKKWVNDANLNEYVFFYGKVSDVKNYIKKSKIFILTSDYEGIPNALIEAMSLGLPCISTDCTPGGARLLIKNGHNGFIVARGDYKAIAEKCVYLYDNPEVSIKLGSNAQSICDKFSPERIYPQWLDYLNKI